MTEGHIFLTGFMGAGKSTVGQLLADDTSRIFIDTDDLIMERTGQAIAELFREKGEEHFRGIESEVVQELAAFEPAVIALGGGAILDHDNRESLRTSGTVVYLRCDFGTLFKRIRADKQRPLASGKSRHELERLFNHRKELYEEADIVVDCAPDMTASEVAARVSIELQRL